MKMNAERLLSGFCVYKISMENLQFNHRQRTNIYKAFSADFHGTSTQPPADDSHRVCLPRTNSLSLDYEPSVEACTAHTSPALAETCESLRCHSWQWGSRARRWFPLCRCKSTGSSSSSWHRQRSRCNKEAAILSHRDSCCRALRSSHRTSASEESWIIRDRDHTSAFSSN